MRLTPRFKSSCMDLYDVLKRAAAAGTIAPSRSEMAVVLGLDSVSSTIGGRLDWLEREGLIRRERGPKRATRVFVVELAAYTAWRPGGGPVERRRGAIPKFKRELAGAIARRTAARNAGEKGVGGTVPRSVVPDIRFATCQYLAGEPRDRDFCGAAVKPGSPYCPEHHAVCYRAVTLSDDGVPDGSAEGRFSGPLCGAQP